MSVVFKAIGGPERLHTRVTRVLAQRVLESERSREVLLFPKEADLSAQLGVSRSVLRESMKVLADKGMIQMKPRAGTRARPRSEWRLLDHDILAWQAEVDPSFDLLRDLCEVRLAFEPTTAGFAAVRATSAEIDDIERSLEKRAASAGGPIERIVDLELEFHDAIVAASHNPLLVELSAAIRTPIRIALTCTSRFASALELGLDAHRKVLECLRRRDPLATRHAAEEAVGVAMLAVENVIQKRKSRGRRGSERR
jgi:GntR family galactonate operon transcriptional repressor